MFDVVSLGELLIDFSQKQDVSDSMVFQANAGGAPGNVLAELAKLGKKTAFIGKVGNDMFGKHLVNTLNNLSVDTRGVIVSNTEFTTLAFVSLDQHGNRSFSFARNNSADVMLSCDELNSELIKNSRIFHCGTLSLTHPVSKKATIKALDIAAENQIKISVDPNLRLNLWKSKQEAKQAIETVMSYAHIIKISDYEIEFLYGDIDIETAAEKLVCDFSPEVLFITCGKNGAYMYSNGYLCYEPCFTNIKTVDTTGAGDCFCGAALSELLDTTLNFNNLCVNNCRKILKFANAAANLSTSKYGAIPSMPCKNEILSLLGVILYE